MSTESNIGYVQSSQQSRATLYKHSILYTFTIGLNGVAAIQSSGTDLLRIMDRKTHIKLCKGWRNLETKLTIKPSGSYPGVLIFQTAIRPSIGLGAGSPYSPEQIRSLSPSLGTKSSEPKAIELLRAFVAVIY
jgi:hypothetical protein